MGRERHMRMGFFSASVVWCRGCSLVFPLAYASVLWFSGFLEALMVWGMLEGSGGCLLADVLFWGASGSGI